MKKLTNRKINVIIKELVPFWKKYWELNSNFRGEEVKLQEIMNKKLSNKLKDIKLEFFYCDGECVGIGAIDFSKRKFFPLIHDTWLNKHI